MTVREALSFAEKELLAGGFSLHEAKVEAMMMVEKATGLERVQVLLSGGILSAEAEQQIMAWIKRRCLREPLQYILGEAWFMGFCFAVRPGVLIPRADTETVCEEALKRIKDGDSVLDLCTGSGALAVSIQRLRPACRVVASDLSPLALETAKENAKTNHADIVFYEGDFLQPLLGQRFHCIVCNPPYIQSEEIPLLQQEVRQEPALALDGGADGLDFYKQLFLQAPDFLYPKGFVVCELGDGQAEAVSALAHDAFHVLSVVKDLGGLSRALVAQLKERGE